MEEKDIRLISLGGGIILIVISIIQLRSLLEEIFFWIVLLIGGILLVLYGFNVLSKRHKEHVKEYAKTFLKKKFSK